MKHEVIYNADGARQVYWPADTNHNALAEALRKARAAGLNARLSEVL